MRLPALLLLTTLAGCAIEPQPAELILTGGTVWTGARDGERAQALAVRRGRVAHAGIADEVARFRGPKTEVIELN